MANRAFNFEVHTGQNRFAVASGCEHSMLKNCVRTFVSRLGLGICLLPQAVLHCARDRLIFRSTGAKRNLFAVVPSINISPRMERRATRLCCTSKLNPPMVNGRCELVPIIHHWWIQL